MRNVSFNVNTDSVIILTAKLERMRKSAFPSAIRSTLNDSAFIMKKENILDSAKKNMVVRNPTFFRKFTGVKRATGFDVNKMQSEVGFKNTDPNPIKGKKAIEGMEHNEVGGTDKDGGMYLGKTRGARGLVKRNYRFDQSKITRSYRYSNIKTRKEGNKSFMSRAYASLNDKKLVFAEAKDGFRYLVRVKSIKRGTKNSKADIKLDFLMRHRSKKPAKAKATHFVKEGALKTQKSIDDFYVKNAEFQFNKIIKSKL